MAFTITDTHLLFAEELVVERAIRSMSSSQTRPIDSLDWFRKAKSIIPSTVGLAGLEDNAVMAEYFWTALRQMSEIFKGMASNSQPDRGRFSIDSDNLWQSRNGMMGRYSRGPGGKLPGMMLPEVGDDTFDFSLLPEFDSVRKYFGLFGFYGISIPEGFFFEIKYLKPESTQ